ncbi:MAG: restriction endonuclease subunit S [Candidatus Sumerlaeaceae bacterium]|nr:restriction endonuclease subunit S [Candidatus Sumerlaeaceae bacterium]
MKRGGNSEYSGISAKSGWPRKPLGEVADVVSGYAFKSSEFGSQGIPVIKIKNIRVGSVDLSEADRVDEKYLSIPERYHVQPGDVLVSLTGSHISQPNSVVGRVARHSASLPHCLLNQRGGKVMVRDQSATDLNFVFYALSEPETLREIAMKAHGAASQANVSPTQVESVEIPLPPFPVQRRIAGILSAYDDLIENSQRRIRILETMARTLYREWFVHFRFLGHESHPRVPSPLGDIPKGWEVKKLKDVCKLTMGQSPKSEFYNETGEGQPFHQGVTNFGDRFPTDRLFCTAAGRIAEEGDILFSVRAPVGRMNIANKRIIIGRGLSAIRHLDGHQAFLWEQLRNKFTEDDMMGNGAIFAAVTKDDMEGVELICPPAPLIEAATMHFEPTHSEVATLAKKIENLRRTRDLLLPRLLSPSHLTKDDASQC